MNTALALAAALLMTPVTAMPQAPDPRRPAPTFDSVPPDLPALGRPAVLIFSKTNGYRHDSIPATVAALSRLVEARGWSGFATENAAVFNPDQLARFDVIVFASATGDMFTHDQRAAFETWLAGGGGFVGIHGAGVDSHPAWYKAILGYHRFTGHPGGADQFPTADVVVDDRRHPATRHLPSRWRWTDEYYSWDAPPAAGAHVLARLDETGMKLDAKYRMGERHALLWWRCEGRARIFFSALGHKAETWADPVHLKMVDGAIGWAARRQGTGCD
ncbi:ThuA domain-containing protein [Sphingopyxis sp.]|uniref:ThuA domain-containing protein n=1 Tax=Sphingopyxis sp. TaxID=1908224 RepID=UPI002EDB886C